MLYDFTQTKLSVHQKINFKGNQKVFEVWTIGYELKTNPKVFYDHFIGTDYSGKKPKKVLMTHKLITEFTNPATNTVVCYDVTYWSTKEAKEIMKKDDLFDSFECIS